jgi:hypothetical protein
MRQFGVDDEVNAALMNSVMDYDAVVDASLSPSKSGTKYKTIQGAVDAGHRFIFVKSGTYSGAVTVVNDSVTIVGEGQAAWNGSAYTATGVRITNIVTVSGDACILENLNVKVNGGSGIIVTGRDCMLANCKSCGNTGTGLHATANNGDIKIWGGEYSDNGAIGVNVGQSATAFIIGVRATTNTTVGIYVGNVAHISGCYVCDNTTYGVQLATAGDDATVIGSVVSGNGVDIDGITAEAANIVTPV